MADPANPLSQWVERLSEQLKKREEEYFLLQVGSRSPATDNEQCRVLALKSATFALTELIVALHEFPQFKHNAGLGPLLDLAAAMHDLTIGGNPRMLESAAGIGTGRDGIGKFYVKRHATIGVLLLIEAGLTAKAARKCVAHELSKHGFKGRKGGALSDSTLFGWVEDCRATEAWPQIIAFVEEWADDKDDPLTKEGALRWIRKMGASPLMQSRI